MLTSIFRRGSDAASKKPSSVRKSKPMDTQEALAAVFEAVETGVFDQESPGSTWRVVAEDEVDLTSPY